MKKKCTAIVLSAGSGKRMNSDTKKQYLLIKEKPVVYYSLKAFQESDIIDEIILVTSADDIDFAKSKIVDEYGFTKVSVVTAGGKERYNSVYNGLKAIGNGIAGSEDAGSEDVGSGDAVSEDVGSGDAVSVGVVSDQAPCDYVFIHDGARPFVTEEIIKRAFDSLEECGTAVVGMPVKDTIKIVDSDINVESTPDRSTVWLVQTPQCFSYDLAMRAYENLIKAENDGSLAGSGINVTDDAMVVESFTDWYKEENEALQTVTAGEVSDDGNNTKGTCERVKVRLVEGSYENIKITTPEDLIVAESFLG